MLEVSGKNQPTSANAGSESSEKNIVSTTTSEQIHTQNAGQLGEQ
jgi:hypothetical protein